MNSQSDAKPAPAPVAEQKRPRFGGDSAPDGLDDKRFGRRPTEVWFYLAATALVALATVAAEGLYQADSNARPPMVFLAAVLITAFMFGARPAYYASALAFISYNFYLKEPRDSFSIRSEDIVTLVVFFSVSMLTGNLTGRVRDQADRATARARTTAALFTATRDLSASAGEESVRRRLVHHLAELARGQAVILHGASRISAPDVLFLPTEVEAQIAALEAVVPGAELKSQEVGNWTLRPLYADDVALGLAGWRPAPGIHLGADQQIMLEILADTGAAAIGRSRLSAAAGDLESWERTDELRNALLASISHDLRTPIAAIVASASSLRDFGSQFDEATREDLAGSIQDSAERLNAFVSNLLNMTKLEAGALTVESKAFEICALLGQAARRYGAAHGRVVALKCPDATLGAMGDPLLFEQALGNVLENALHYTARSVAVELACAKVGQKLVVTVSDRGPGVSPAELPLLFVKFYRSSKVAKKSGTGLGLSIAKGLIEGMDGSISARTRVAPETGLIVTLELPVAQK